MTDLEQLDVALPQDLLTSMQAAVASGEYGSINELVHDALREWLEHREERESRIDAIRQKIEAAANNPERLTDVQVTRHFDEMLATVRKKAS